MKSWILSIILSLSVGQVLAAETTDAPATAEPTASPTPQPLKLSGTWGFGFDSIPGASAGTGLVPGLTAPNALAVRYWVTENLAWDGLFALDLNSQPPGGAGATGVPAGTDQRGLGGGTMLKYNLKRPTKWLLAQAVGRASLASLQQVSNTGGGGQTTSTLGLSTGLGFEAFLPFWDALSVEGNILVSFISSQTKVEGVPQAAQSGSSLSIDAAGFTPLNVGIHLYF